MVVINCINWSAVAHFIYYVIADFKRILDIKVFSIKPNPPEQPGHKTTKAKSSSPTKIRKQKRKPTLKKSK